MREITLKIAFVIGVLLIVQSCYYEYPPEPSPIDPELVSFRTHVLPILTKNCATDQCHDGSKVPDLRDSIAFENVSFAYRDLVIKGGYVNTTFPDKSELLESIISGVGGLSMPPDGALPERDIELIRAWMLKGALND